MAALAGSATTATGACAAATLAASSTVVLGW
jgi:hypothetical protein